MYNVLLHFSCYEWLSISKDRDSRRKDLGTNVNEKEEIKTQATKKKQNE